MSREDLEVLFCFKIGKELEQFKDKIAKMDLDEIMARAYQVDTIITIYELLLEMSRQLGKEILRFDGDLMRFVESDETVKEAQEWAKVKDDDCPFK